MTIWHPKRWQVVNMAGDSFFEVEATYASVTATGALHFNVYEEAAGPAKVVRAFSPGYWSQMTLISDAFVDREPDRDGTIHVVEAVRTIDGVDTSSVLAVFSTEAKAQAYIDANPVRSKEESWYVDAYELDEK